MGRGDFRHKKRRQRDPRGNNGVSGGATSQGTQGIPASLNRRGKGLLLFQSLPEGLWLGQHLDFHAASTGFSLFSYLRNCERINCYCFKPRMLWYFVMMVIGNWRHTTWVVWLMHIPPLSCHPLQISVHTAVWMGNLSVEKGLKQGLRDLSVTFSLSTFMLWRRKWQPTPVFLPGESQG